MRRYIDSVKCSLKPLQIAPFRHRAGVFTAQEATSARMLPASIFGLAGLSLGYTLFMHEQLIRQETASTGTRLALILPVLFVLIAAPYAIPMDMVREGAICQPHLPPANIKQRHLATDSVIQIRNTVHKSILGRLPFSNHLPAIPWPCASDIDDVPLMSH